MRKIQGHLGYVPNHSPCPNRLLVRHNVELCKLVRLIRTYHKLSNLDRVISRSIQPRCQIKTQALASQFVDTLRCDDDTYGSA